MIVETELITDIVLIAGGIIAGIFSGFFGIGGGIILVPVQYNLLTANFLVDPDIALRTAFATSLGVTLPAAISSAYGHHKKRMIFWRIAIIAGISGFIGGILGGFISINLPATVLAPFFAFVLFTMAIFMIVSKSNQDIGRIDLRNFPYIISGLLVGIFSGMLGIGGGIIIAPVFMIFCRMPSRIASATTSIFVIAASSGGIFSYIILGGYISDFPFLTLGYLNISWWILLVLVTVPMAQIGVHLLHRVDPVYLKYVFFLVLMYFSVNMLGSW